MKIGLKKKKIENVEKEEKIKKEKHHSGNNIGIRIIAGILAFLMVASLAFTVIVYLID